MFSTREVQLALRAIFCSETKHLKFHRSGTAEIFLLHAIYVMKVILHVAAVCLCFCSFDCNICRDCRVQVPLHCVSSACQPDRWKRTIAREYWANIYRLVNNSVQWHFSSDNLCVLWKVRSPNFVVRSGPVDCWLSYLCVFTYFLYVRF